MDVISGVHQDLNAIFVQNVLDGIRIRMDWSLHRDGSGRNLFAADEFEALSEVFVAGLAIG